MNAEFELVDLRKATPEELEKGVKLSQLAFIYNQTMPGTPEYTKAMNDLFGDHLGESSFIAAPISRAGLDRIKLGKNSFIGPNSLLMARGGIIIGDDVQIAANCQLITNNHDECERMVLPYSYCK